ncbi:GNAT family N-acetyltransferase [Niallia sp. 03133]|uniref:GNAT family N-acetyltransferase n=1 Tax=Niallia sp. 03133 TaxID=3458060 RepID=UPI004044567A
MEIMRINKEQTWELRQKVMWPDKNIDYIKLPDDDQSIHYGLFKGEKLLSIITLHTEQDEAQFRKFATLKEEQGKGIGSKLLDHVIAESAKMGIKRLWCNARQNKTSFYQKFGLKATDQVFEKGGIGYVIMEMYI